MLKILKGANSLIEYVIILFVFFIAVIFIKAQEATAKNKPKEELIEDVKSISASRYEYSSNSTFTIPLIDEIRLSWDWEKNPDDDRKGVLLIRRKGLLPDRELLKNGENYIGPEITSEFGEEKRKYIAGCLDFATKTQLKASVYDGLLLSLPLSSTDFTVSHPDFSNLPIAPRGGKCYLLISAGANGDRSEIVSYVTVGENLIITRGELNTHAVSHSTNASVTYLPPRPIPIAEPLNEELPSNSNHIIINVDKFLGLGGFPASGVIRVGDEIMEYEKVDFGSNYDTLKISKRGLNNSRVTKHAVGSKIFWNNHPTYIRDSISVTSTEGFPRSGRLKIDEEEIWYHSKTATSFEGIVRGIFTDDAFRADTYVVAHPVGSEVIDSLNKVILNDQDLDGPLDSNNDFNEDEITDVWLDSLYFGEEASEYYYYLLTYDKNLNYSKGKSVSVNPLSVKQLSLSTSLSDKIKDKFVNPQYLLDARGGEKLYFSVEGGVPDYAWTATTSGITVGSAPPEVDRKGELTRYISFTVPECLTYPEDNIKISVVDSSTNQLKFTFYIYVISGCILPNKDLFHVTSGIGQPVLNTNVDATVRIYAGDQITFTAVLPASGDKSSIVWSAKGVYTFGGQGVILSDNPDKLVYTAISNFNPDLTEGIDEISVTDGINTIVITIIVSDSPGCYGCCESNLLSVVPGNDGSITIDPGASVKFFASGGTCSFIWTLIVNNSENATIERSSSTSAVYTAGKLNHTVDIIELTDGRDTKRIEIHISKPSSGSFSNSCFLRNKTAIRD